MKKLFSLLLSLSLLAGLALPAATVRSEALPSTPQADPVLLVDPDENTGAYSAVIDARIQAAGGVPGQLNVMINGRCVSFPDAVPEAVNGRTMVPLRAAMEALGARVDYDAAAGAARVSLDGQSFTHAIGTGVLTAADGSVLQMDTASYAKDGRTMVPLRFFSQALGYEVLWDAVYNTAVIVDQDALAQSIDRNFTILNEAIKKQSSAIDYTQNLQCGAALSGTFTLLDTISGDTSYDFSAGVSALIGRQAAEVSMGMDLSFVSQLLDAMEEERPQWVDALLRDLSLRMICSGNTAWLNSPALIQAMREDGVQLPDGDLWFQADGLDEFGPMPYLDYLAQASGGTVGENACLAAAALAELSPFAVYSQVWNIADAAALVIGDSTWTQNGEAWQWHMDMDTLDAAAAALTGEDGFFTGMDDGLRFSIDLTIQADGSCTFTVDGSLYSELLGRDAARLTASGSSSAASGEMELHLQVLNLCDLVLNSTSTVEATSLAPASQPPAGSVIVDENGQLPA